MTAGGIATWKVKEGQAFSAGDVLLEIETDKATMDVEAQDDGVLAKIVVQDGAKDVNVGKIIAMLAEEGDDISNVEVPKDDSASSASSGNESKPASSEKESKTTPSETNSKSDPQSSSQTGASTGAAAPSSSGSSTSNAGTHASFKGPLFPSVQRLIAENHIEEAESKIKGTGIRGMITKGDVLAFLGQAKSPTGSFKEGKGGIAVLGPKQAHPKGTAGASSGPVEVSAIRSLSASPVLTLPIYSLFQETHCDRSSSPGLPLLPSLQSSLLPRLCQHHSQLPSRSTQLTALQKTMQHPPSRTKLALSAETASAPTILCGTSSKLQCIATLSHAPMPMPAPERPMDVKLCC